MRGWAMAGLLAVVLMAVAGTARAEFWTTQYFLTQPPDQQRSYVVGLMDMYQHTRRVIAPDPTDLILVCLRTTAIDVVRSKFIDWVLGEPPLWRLSPAALFVKAMEEDICRK